MVLIEEKSYLLHVFNPLNTIVLLWSEVFQGSFNWAPMMVSRTAIRLIAVAQLDSDFLHDVTLENSYSIFIGWNLYRLSVDVIGRSVLYLQ